MDFRTTHSESLVDEAFQALVRGGSNDWPALLRRMSTSVPAHRSASLKTVAQLQHLMRSPRFIAIPDSWILLHFLLRKWDWFAQPFHQTLASATAHAFDRFETVMGPLIAAEILGDRCADSWALERLLKFSCTAPPFGRTAVPHGLQWFVRSTRDAALKARALETLSALTASEVPEISSEANAALLKLQCTYH